MEALIEEMLAGRILLSEAVGEFEKIYIQKALAANDGHLSNTADALGIHRNTVSKHVNGHRPTKKPAKKPVARRRKAIKTSSRARSRR
jgi:DNA-binding NtrC family response regulator